MLLISAVVVVAIIGWYLFKNSNKSEISLSTPTSIPVEVSTCQKEGDLCFNGTECCDGLVCVEGVCIKSTPVEIVTNVEIPVEPVKDIQKTSRGRKKKTK